MSSKDITSDNGAVLAGYTEEYIITSGNGQYEIHVSAMKDADLDSVLNVFDHDCQEMIQVNGWLWHWEDV